MLFFEILNQLLVLFLLMMTGYIIRKVGIINKESTSGLSAVLTKVALPATVFVSMQRPFTEELFVEITQIMFIFFCVQIFSMAVAFLLCKIMNVPFCDRGMYALILGFCNMSFMGYPVLIIIFGKESLFYASYCNTIHTAVMFSIGIAICIRYSGKEKLPMKQSLKLILRNNAFLAGVIGFIFFVSSIAIPKQISGVLELLGSLTTPVSMLIIGSLLTQNRFSELISDWKQYILAAFRLVFISISLFYFFKWTGWLSGSVLVPILCVIMAMPSSATVPVLAVEYGSNENAAFSSRLAFITTFFSLITIPIVASFIRE